MRWGRIPLVVRVAWASRHAPRDVSSRWDRFWAGVRATGDGGDVLWDSSTSGEPAACVDLLAAYADPGLPAVDVGCGNGRFTRALAARFHRVLGVDVSARAVHLARSETVEGPGVGYRVLDVTVAGVGRQLADELGPCNVLVRGVLHVLDPAARRRVAANLADLLGARGTLLVVETNHRGGPLDYLERLGAGPAGLPHALRSAVSSGLPRPSAFGATELERCFPGPEWERLHTDDRARLGTVPLSPDGPPQLVPGYIAVLRRSGG